MPMKFAYDPKSKTIFLKRSGTLMPDELLKGMQKFSELSEFSEAKKLFSDMRDVDLSQVTDYEVEMHAQFCEDKLKHLTVVVLAEEDLIYGLSRRFGMMSNLENVYVVRTMDEALERLGLDEIPAI